MNGIKETIKLFLYVLVLGVFGVSEAVNIQINNQTDSANYRDLGAGCRASETDPEYFESSNQDYRLKPGKTWRRSVNNTGRPYCYANASRDNTVSTYERVDFMVSDDEPVQLMLAHDDADGYYMSCNEPILESGERRIKIINDAATGAEIKKVTLTCDGNTTFTKQFLKAGESVETIMVDDGGTCTITLDVDDAFSQLLAGVDSQFYNVGGPADIEFDTPSKDTQFRIIRSQDKGLTIKNEAFQYSKPDEWGNCP